jgi:hypothetical protein
MMPVALTVLMPLSFLRAIPRDFVMSELSFLGPPYSRANVLE